jgi:uncharacterized protein (DUF58 family)
MGRPPLRAHRILGPIVRSYEENLTARGRRLVWALAVFALVGVDTRRTQVFRLFAVAAAVFLAAELWALFRWRKVPLEGRLPERATALTPVSIRLVLPPSPARGDLLLTIPRPLQDGAEVDVSPREAFAAVDPGGPVEVPFVLTPRRRGRYVLRGPSVRPTDPLRLVAGRASRLPDQLLIVYPRFYGIEDFPVPVGRRYQPGGIPLSSSTGDAIEFVGTRDYREGDPIRTIHWRSWARRGEPVVKEYQEEYFCRIAIILDTFMQPKPDAAAIRSFESAISVVASIADHFSRSEYIVDILAAGPDVYEVSAGRSLAYLENILDVLGCLGPCHDVPFRTIGPQLFDKLAAITTVVAVLQDWDDTRQDFLRRVKALGTSVWAIVVHDGPTTTPWERASAELDRVSLMTTADVEAALAANAPAKVAGAATAETARA